jgi:hypothetical protein
LFEVRVYPCAERFLDKCSEEDREELIGALDTLVANPYVDGETKFIFQAPPVMLKIFRSSTHWIVYHVHESKSQVQVFNIGRRGVDKPSFRCPGVE